jgi:hypothetical protein
MKRRLEALERAVRAQGSDAKPVRSDWLSRLTGRDVYLPANTTWLEVVREVCDEQLDALIGGDDLGCNEDYPPGPDLFPHLSEAELDAIIAGDEEDAE